MNDGADAMGCQPDERCHRRGKSHRWPEQRPWPWQRLTPVQAGQNPLDSSDQHQRPGSGHPSPRQWHWSARGAPDRQANSRSWRFLRRRRSFSSPPSSRHRRCWADHRGPAPAVHRGCCAHDPGRPGINRLLAPTPAIEDWVSPQEFPGPPNVKPGATTHSRKQTGEFPSSRGLDHTR